MDFFIKYICFFVWIYLLNTSAYSYESLISFQVVQEYERAVIFRLGRLLKGGAKGPGIVSSINLHKFIK